MTLVNFGDLNTKIYQSQKCRRQQTARTGGVLPNEHYGINVMAQTVTLRCMIDSFEKIRKILEIMRNPSKPHTAIDTRQSSCKV